MKKFLQLSIISVLLLTPVLGQNNDSSITASDPREFIGDYVYSSGYDNAVFKIMADGKYKYNTSDDCFCQIWRESGSYDLRDNIIHFKITTKTLNNYNLLDPEQAYEAFRKIYQRQGRATELWTEYDMQIVRWGERIYLLEPDRMNLFTAAVNLGFEPRLKIVDDNYITYRFFLRENEADKPVVGKPVLSEPWNSYLQDSQIKVVVTKIELQNQEKIYTVDKGSANGIKVGMFLTGENTKPEPDDLLKVISVEENSATLKSSPIFRAPKYQSGDTLITKTLKNPR